MARRLLSKIGTLIFIVIFLFQCYLYFNYQWEQFGYEYYKVAQELQTLQHFKTKNITVYSKNKTCSDHFHTLGESLDLLLKMKTDEATELSLQRLGMPYKTNSIDDFTVPQFVQQNIPVNIPTIVSAASSNHFGELQALLYYIDTEIRRFFPDIKVVIYDIGLKTSEIDTIRKYGRVEYRFFNFDIYPPHIKKLQLCAWKPIIIQEILREDGYVMYLDTSVRPQADQLQRYFDMSVRTGHVFRSVSIANTITDHTFSPTFTFFKVSPCLYHGLAELEGGYIIIRRDSLVSLVIWRSVLACSLQEQCIMPRGAESRTSCAGPSRYHKCHRNDQSAIGITVFMVYHQFNRIPLFKVSSFKTKRGERSDYLVKSKHK